MTHNLLTLSEVCNILSISPATGRNWVRFKKLNPATSNKPFLFDSHSIHSLLHDIKSGKVESLKSRRNKKQITGKAFYHDYLHRNSRNLPIVESILKACDHCSFMTDYPTIVLAEYALKLLCDAKKISPSSAYPSDSCYLSLFLNGGLSVGLYAPLINDLLCSVPLSLINWDMLSSSLSFQVCYIKQEDFLGLLYLSMLNLSSRKATGSYYTPASVVDRMATNLFCTDLYDINLCDTNLYHVKPFDTESFETYIQHKDEWGNDSSCKILDPCCGTGNFLISMTKYIKDATKLYGQDTDITAVKLARINLALCYPIKTTSLIETLYHNIICCDSLYTKYSQKFDFIVGNPPWGYTFTSEEVSRLQKDFYCANLHPESYDLFIEHALLNAPTGCILSVVLPEAILNVRTHQNIRHLILKHSQIKRIDYLGNIFDGVQCPAIVLTLQVIEELPSNHKFMVTDVKISRPGSSFTIQSNRYLDSSCINLNLNDEEFAVLNYMEQARYCTTLKDQADFALGIVTGDNKNKLLNYKTEHNELVLRGSNLTKYHIKPPYNYIVYTPQTLQQCAPDKYYRAPEKLLYRFIGTRLVFYYDNKQLLSLNSCNILIPRIPGLSMKYILAILNSESAQIYYTHKFHSLKVLRSYLEQIPIPIVDAKQQEKVIKLVNELEITTSPEDFSKVQKRLDKIIWLLYQR